METGKMIKETDLAKRFGQQGTNMKACGLMTKEKGKVLFFGTMEIKSMQSSKIIKFGAWSKLVTLMKMPK